MIERADFGSFERDLINTTQPINPTKWSLLCFIFLATKLDFLKKNDRERWKQKKNYWAVVVSDVSIAMEGKDNKTVVIMNREIRERERERENFYNLKI